MAFCFLPCLRSSPLALAGLRHSSEGVAAAGRCVEEVTMGGVEHATHVHTGRSKRENKGMRVCICVDLDRWTSFTSGLSDEVEW